MYYRTEALSLLRYDFKERASRYVLLTTELGKIEARMEGARNIHSKLSPQMEPVSLVDVYLVKGKAGYKLIQVSNPKRYSFSTPEQWSFVWHLAESVHRLVPTEVVEQGLLDCLVQFFDYLERGGAVSRGLWGIVYLRLLFLLGYFPGHLLVSVSLRNKAEAFLSMGFADAIVSVEQEDEIISLVLNTVKEQLQTENKSSGYLKEVLRLYRI